VLCATAGPCLQNEKSQIYHVGVEKVKDGVFKYPDYATTKKLRCGLIHPGRASTCENLLATKAGLLIHQRREEHLILCHVCRVWHHVKETCTHPFRHPSEMPVVDDNIQNMNRQEHDDAESDDDVKSDIQEQGPMVDNLLGHRKGVK